MHILAMNDTNGKECCHSWNERIVFVDHCHCVLRLCRYELFVVCGVIMMMVGDIVAACLNLYLS